MPRLIGKSVVVVDHDGLVIRECAGHVATREKSEISVARVSVRNPTSEPWLTIDYDEWLCVTRGKMELHAPDGSIVTASAGETAFVARGERFRPIFPEGDTEYIPVCLPAFAPERCIREEEEGASDVSAKLRELHSGADGGGGGSSDRDETKETESIPMAPSSSPQKQPHEDIERLYHMCQKGLWDQAVREERAYFPPTFEKDGMFTHATAIPRRLITTANHFYTSTRGDWICLALSRSALLKLGIQTVFEEAKPVGDTGVGQSWDWICPHIFGGIPTHVDGVVLETYEMSRGDDGSFLSIVGLTED